MNKQNKFVAKCATWFITPDGSAYIGSILDDNKDEWISRHKKMIKDPAWNGYKFIRTPISIPVPDAVVNKVIME